jgi:hypothetical protein
LQSVSRESASTFHWPADGRESLTVEVGGPGEIRTLDLFHAMEARSQLRHRPTAEDFLIITSTRHGRRGALDRTLFARAANVLILK